MNKELKQMLDQRDARIAEIEAALGETNEALAACRSEAGGRISQLQQALREAMEWNWIDGDVPPDVVELCEVTLGKGSGDA